MRICAKRAIAVVNSLSVRLYVCLFVWWSREGPYVRRHGQQCWVVIVIHLALPVTPLIGLCRSSLVKSTTSVRLRPADWLCLYSTQSRPQVFDARTVAYYCLYLFFPFFLSPFQAVDLEGEGSATRFLRFHSALFFTSTKSTPKSSMFYLTTSIHLFLCLPLLRCPRTFVSKVCLTQSFSFRRCTCPLPKPSQLERPHHSSAQTALLAACEAAWRCWCTSLCTASIRHTCRTTASSSLRWDVGTSGHRTSTRVPCHGHSHRLATGVSRQLVRGYGTACRLTFG